MSALASYEALDDEVGVSDSFLFQSGLVWSHEGIWRMSAVNSISVGRDSCTLDA